MNKKYNLALFALAFALLYSNFASNVFAQKTDAPKSEQPAAPQQQCSGEKFVMPPSIALGGEAFTTFIKVMSLPSGARQKAFSDLSNEGKANVFKVRLALNFITRPNLTREQKDLILETISMTSADTYDKANPEKATKTDRQVIELENKALGIFPRDEVYQIFANMNGDTKADVALLQKYEEMLKLPMSARKQAVLTASPIEKSNFWKAQMLYYLATAKLNRNQLMFITEVFPLITLNAFNFPTVKGQDRNEETKNLVAFVSKGGELFSKEEFFTIFMGYGIHKTIPDKAGNGSNDLEAPGRTCNCNYVCGLDSTCTATSCSISTSGCGVLGNSECHSFCIKD